MSSLEKLQKRNQDCMLIETIKQVGVSNYSLIARLTGLNPETVRYKINKQLSKFGLNVSININYGELGFSMGLLSVKANSKTGRSWVDHMSYLVMLGKIVTNDRYICLYAVPFRFKKRYLDVIESLKTKGLIDDYEAQELYWIRYPPFRSELYDFDTKSWVIDWKRVDAPTKEIGATAVSVNRDSNVDLVDLKILRALQEDPTTDLAKVGKDLNANPRTLRYHHTEHVVKGNFILGNNVKWARPLLEGRPGDLMQVSFAFKELGQEEINQVRKLFNKLPFTWLEAGTENRQYYAFLDMPIIHFHDTIRHLEERIESLRGRYETTLLDPTKTQSWTVPDEMFDKKIGWRLLNYQPSEVESRPEG
ncbi:MAG: hypothetical protein HYY68_04620 [Thaumarchaeota archaeon]|nr:hypothetical protein [Nitrososphaerota archaeon]MBI3116867.1 hypothetical protein [Nitrososphaerota archaeon]